MFQCWLQIIHAVYKYICFNSKCQDHLKSNNTEIIVSMTPPPQLYLYTNMCKHTDTHTYIYIYIYNFNTRHQYTKLTATDLQKSYFTAYQVLGEWLQQWLPDDIPDSKVHGANMGPTWVLLAPDGPHVGPMNLAIRDGPLINQLFVAI